MNVRKRNVQNIVEPIPQHIHIHAYTYSYDIVSLPQIYNKVHQMYNKRDFSIHSMGRSCAVKHNINIKKKPKQNIKNKKSNYHTDTQRLIHSATHNSGSHNRNHSANEKV